MNIETHQHQSRTHKDGSCHNAEFLDMQVQEIYCFRDSFERSFIGLQPDKAVFYLCSRICELHVQFTSTVMTVSRVDCLGKLLALSGCRYCSFLAIFSPFLGCTWPENSAWI